MYALRIGVHTTLGSFCGSVCLGLRENLRSVELIFIKFNCTELKKMATDTNFSSYHTTWAHIFTLTCVCFRAHPENVFLNNCQYFEQNLSKMKYKIPKSLVILDVIKIQRIPHDVICYASFYISDLARVYSVINAGLTNIHEDCPCLLF